VHLKILLRLRTRICSVGHLNVHSCSSVATSADQRARLPTNLVGGPAAVIEQIGRCGSETGLGVIDLMFQNPGNELGFLVSLLELF